MKENQVFAYSIRISSIARAAVIVTEKSLCNCNFAGGTCLCMWGASSTLRERYSIEKLSFSFYCKVKQP